MRRGGVTVRARALLSAVGIVLLSGSVATSAAIVSRAQSRHEIVATIPTGPSAAGLAFAQRTGFLYVAIAHTDEVVVLDADTRTVSDRIPVGVAPFGIAFDTRRGYLYVTNSQADTVSVIDGATNTVVRTIPLAAGPLPAGLSPMGIV